MPSGAVAHDTRSPRAVEPRSVETRRPHRKLSYDRELSAMYQQMAHPPTVRSAIFATPRNKVEAATNWSAPGGCHDTTVDGFTVRDTRRLADRRRRAGVVCRARVTPLPTGKSDTRHRRRRCRSQAELAGGHRDARIVGLSPNALRFETGSCFPPHTIHPPRDRSRATRSPHATTNDVTIEGAADAWGGSGSTAHRCRTQEASGAAQVGGYLSTASTTVFAKPHDRAGRKTIV